MLRKSVKWCIPAASLLVASLAYGESNPKFGSSQGPSVRSPAATGSQLELHETAYQPKRERGPTEPPIDLALTALQGVSLYGESLENVGLAYGAAGLLRAGMAGVGLSVEAVQSVFSTASLSEVALLAGMSSRSATGVRVDLLGSISMHAYRGWGASEYGTEGTNKGVSASLPCVGARMRLAYFFSQQRRIHFLLGGQFNLDVDVAHKTVSSENNTMPAQQVVGGQRAVVGLILGVVFDIGSDR
jgi:hypothetical protein